MSNLFMEQIIREYRAHFKFFCKNYMSIFSKG